MKTKREGQEGGRRRERQKGQGREGRGGERERRERIDLASINFYRILKSESLEQKEFLKT